MKDLMDQLQAQGVVLNPPATSAAIASFETSLGSAIPAELRDLYTNFNGMSECGELWFDLYKVEDIQGTYQELDTWEWYEDTELLQAGIPLGMDIGGNLLMYLTLPECPNRIAYVNHESPAEPEVHWGSLRELLEHACAKEGTPSMYPAHAGTRADDGVAADACIKRWQAAEGYECPLYFLSLACNVLPQDRLSEMIGWLRTIALEQMRPIYSSLGQRQRTDQSNRDILAALETAMLRAEELGGSYGSDLTWIAEAIASTGTLEARQSLLRLGSQLSPTQMLALERALKSLGGKVSRVSSPMGSRGYALQVSFPDSPDSVTLTGRARISK
jgi:SMI1 / KNR4 family (SUKH-1)